MLRNVALLISGLTLLAADDPWVKVRDLKSGAEVRVYKRGSAQPLLAKIDEAREESLVVVLKNEQVAIPKQEIDRVDYRPPQSRGHVTKETKTTTDVTDGKGPSSSSSTTYNFGSKPDFQTIYRRTASAPAVKK